MLLSVEADMSPKTPMPARIIPNAVTAVTTIVR